MMGLMVAIILQPRTQQPERESFMAYARRKWAGK